jgi:RNA polymerase sigma-70 factor (ECF subfamily)
MVDLEIPLPRDDQLFGPLYRGHIQAVYRLANSLCGSKLASDVTQEVFLQLWLRPENFDPSKGSLRALLLTMAHHKSVDMIRSESARYGREGRTDPNDWVMFEPDESWQRDETARRVRVALNDLPSNQREAVVAAFYGQCSYRDAAVVLGQPEGTTKARIRAGLSHMRRALSDSSDSQSFR